MRKIKTKGCRDDDDDVIIHIRSLGETPKVTMYPYCTACTVLYK